MHALEKQAAALAFIHNHDWKYLLEDWSKSLEFATSRIERKETLKYHVKNEIYQLIGFFIVFQGVILTTVSQSNNLRCENWWSPFLLSAIVTVATLGGVVLKSFDYVKWRNGVKELQSEVKELIEQINLLKQNGAQFNPVRHSSTPRDRNRPRTLRSKDRIIFTTFVSLVVILIGFAAIVLLSCRAILCSGRL